MTLEKNHQRRVVKLGGSLLKQRHWPELLERFWQTLSPANTLLIVGGGELADILRHAHKQQGYSDGVMHAAAIQCMDIQAILVADLWPRAVVCADQQQLARLTDDAGNSTAAPTAAVQLLQLRELLPSFIARSNANQIPLPKESWDVTSDSLAAWIAMVWQADELVLLKSCSPQAVGCGENDLFCWSAEKYVDRDFCTWADHIPKVRAVDLSKK